MAKRKAPPSRTPSPNPKRFREEGIEVVYLPPDAVSVQSYTEENLDELRQIASAQLQSLMDQAAILRDSPISQQPQPNAKAKSKGAAKGKGKGKGKSTKQQASEEPDWLPGWEFFHKRPPGRASRVPIQRQLDYIEQMKKGWRPEGSKKMGMPEDWFQEETVIVLANNRPWDMEKYDREKINKTRMSFYVEPIGEHLDRIPTKDLIRRHLSTRLSQAILPDFCLAFRITRPEEQFEESNIEISPCLEKWLEIVNFPMGEHNVEMCVLSAFTNIPLCWMLMTPKQRFLEPLAFEEPSQKIEFALILNQVRPLTTAEVDATRELPISYNNPALLIGMKGPDQWPDFLQKWDQPPHFDTDEWRKMTQTQRLSWCVENLACAVQPSLDVLVMTWSLRVAQQITTHKSTNADLPIYPPGSAEELSEFAPLSDDEEEHPERLEWKELPEWAWIPGILYDYNMCYLVAHIPVLPADRNSTEPVEYISYIFDEIPILRPPSGDDDDRYCLVERVRLGLAWMALSKHAHRLASMWDSVIQPTEVQLYEEFATMATVSPNLVKEPEDGTRTPTRYNRANRDLCEKQPGYASDVESLHYYDDMGIDDALTIEEAYVDAWHKRMRPEALLAKEKVVPKVEEWMSRIEDGFWEVCGSVEFDEESDEGSGEELPPESQAVVDAADSPLASSESS